VDISKRKCKQLTFCFLLRPPIRSDKKKRSYSLFPHNILIFLYACPYFILKVNHEKCWIDSETGFTTNVIEGEWRPLKEAKCIPKQSYNEKSINPYLLVVTWRRLHNANLFDRLLHAIRFHCTHYKIQNMHKKLLLLNTTQLKV
jgi:hypothetical protein